MVVYRFCLLVFLLLVLIPTGISADNHTAGMPFTSFDYLGGDGLVPNCWCRLGQRLIIPDKIVTSIGYNVWRVGNPTGNITFSIYNATTNTLITSKNWGYANNLTEWEKAGPSRQSVVLDEPIRISGEIKICVEYYGGNSTDYCVAGYYAGDRVTGEYYTNYRYRSWIDIGEAEEGAYYYEYADEWSDVYPESSNYWWTLSIIPIGFGIYFGRRVMNKRKTSEAKRS